MKLELGNWKKWVPVLLVGLLLAVIALPTGKSSEAGSSKNGYGGNYVSGSGNSKSGIGTSMYGTGSGYFGATEAEERLENLLGKIPGVGEAHVMITYKEDKKVEGILVLAEGGGNPVVVKEIKEIMEALFAVEPHKIKVIAGKS